VLARSLSVLVAVGSLLLLSGVAQANVALRVVSQDPYTNATSYHRTEVEPDTFAFGSVIVGTFQTGRFFDGGASNVGWSRSVNGGATWRKGFLPGTTVYATPPGPFARVSDPTVAYDPAHNVWMIATLALDASVSGAAVIVNRSTNGGLTWGNPVVVRAASGFQDFDKDWITCDGTPTSPFYGHCYVQWDDFGNGNRLMMSTSTDGGLTWNLASTPNSIVIGGQPVVQPNGNVVVPIDDAFESQVESFVSTDGGLTYVGPFSVASIASHLVAGTLRTSPLPSAAVDAGGKIYVTWQDCRFRTSCRSNDIVLSTSTDGANWTAPVRVPIDAVTTTVDHFLPGIDVQPGTSGATAHLGLTYYFYPNTNCTQTSCQLLVGFVSSPDGGASWTAPVQVTGPFRLTWLANTSQGWMVGDYISTSFVGSLAFPVVAAAAQGSCQLGAITCNEAMVAPRLGLAAVGGGGLQAAGLDAPVPGVRSDHTVAEPVSVR
jgi:hypothetical protein